MSIIESLNIGDTVYFANHEPRILTYKSRQSSYNKGWILGFDEAGYGVIYGNDGEVSHPFHRGAEFKPGTTNEDIRLITCPKVTPYQFKNFVAELT